MRTKEQTEKVITAFLNGDSIGAIAEYSKLGSTLLPRNITPEQVERIIRTYLTAFRVKYGAMPHDYYQFPLQAAE